MQHPPPITFRCPSDLRESLQRQADREGKDLTGICLPLLRDHQPTSADRKVTRRALEDLKRAGNRLNQFTRHLHKLSNQGLPIDPAAIRQALAEYRVALDAFRATLIR